MTENPKQPKPYDVVLGGNNPPYASSKSFIGLPFTKPHGKEARVPVLYPNGTPATPTQLRRAQRWIETGKAREVYNAGVFTVQLVEKASRSHNKSTDVKPKTSANFSSVETSSGSEKSANGCLVLIKWIFWAGVAIGFVNDPEAGNTFIESVAAFCAGAWVIGLISPSLVIRFGLPKSRWTVTLIYLTLTIILGGISSASV